MNSWNITALPNSNHLYLAKNGTKKILQGNYPDKPLKALAICLRTCFKFSALYEQIRGTPMSSPISGFLSEAVMLALENVALLRLRP